MDCFDVLLSVECISIIISISISTLVSASVC